MTILPSTAASPWAATASPAPPTPPLLESRRADVAIVGAGLTGLSAALHLAGRGLETVVLEAADPGWGASGRNGGQVIATLKCDLDELEARFGREEGERLVKTIGASPDDVFEVIDKHGIACDAVRHGWIQGAHAAGAVGLVRRRAEQWMRRGAPVVLLDRQRVSELIGTDAYHGGWLDRRAGSIHPLSYARGLARAATAAGAAIHGGSRVTALEPGLGGWRVRTATGATVDVGQVLIATDGYTDALWPGLAQTVIAANSLQVATTPLPPALRRHILPGGQVTSDTGPLSLYFRLDPAGRLLMGGRGHFRAPRGWRDYAHLEAAVRRLFPSLGDVEFEFRWGGRVAITADFLPHVHQPAPGVLACIGYSGRGVAMATTLGKLIAAHLTDPGSGALPLPFAAIQPIPFHALHKARIDLVVAWHRFCDTLIRGRRRRGRSSFGSLPEAG